MEKLVFYFLEKKNKKSHNASVVIEANNELYKFVTYNDHLVIKKTNRSSLKSDDYLRIELSIEGMGEFQHVEAGMSEAIADAFSNLPLINKRLLEEVPDIATELFKSSNVVLG